MPAYRTVIFDCDSTLSDIEGIEEIAGDRRREVEALTDAAMRGEVPLEEVYGRRLEIIRPHRSVVEGLVDRYMDGLVEDAAHLVAALAGAGVDVRIVSGGLLPAVLGLARHLGVADHGVAAVPIRFTDDGAYAGFDELSPAARAGGKGAIIRAWRVAEPPMEGPVMLVGDGATDAEAREDVDLFVAYAGVVARPAVLAAAAVVVRSRSLAPVLPLALGDVRPDDEGASALMERARTMIRDGAVEWK